MPNREPGVRREKVKHGQPAMTWEAAEMHGHEQLGDLMWTPHEDVDAKAGGPMAAQTYGSDNATTRTVISVVLSSDVETKPDVIECTVAAIQALPTVASVSSRKVRAQARTEQPHERA